MKKLTVAQFSDWLEQQDAVFRDDEMVSFSAFEKDVDEAVYILDMDPDFPTTLMEIDEHNSVIVLEDCGQVVVNHFEIRRNGISPENKWIFKPLKVQLSDDNSYIDKKETIAGIIFEDNDLSEDYDRPNEEECHRLAELILNRFNGDLSTKQTNDKESVVVTKSTLKQILAYIHDQEEEACQEYVQDGGHEDDHIFSVIKHVESEVENQPKPTVEESIQVFVIDREEELIEKFLKFTDGHEAEKCFIEQCAHYLSNFDEYTQADIDAILENGYEQNPKWKILIYHD